MAQTMTWMEIDLRASIARRAATRAQILASQATRPQTAHYYYSDALSSDSEGNLVQLCDAHATQHCAVVQFASQGDSDCKCELCDGE